MKGLARFFIRYPLAADLLMILLFIAGVYGLLHMRSTAFPEVESRIITIQTVLPGASPEEIEEGIILKIEENLKGVTGVERVSSVSQENAGVITVEALKGFDTEKVLDDVRNAVDRIPSFPVGMEPPVIFRNENIGFAISFALSGPVDLKTLKAFARRTQTELLAREGISKVTLNGFPAEEIQIAVREKDLEAFRMTFAEVEQAVRAANLDLTGGTIKGEKEELLIRARNKGYFADDLLDIPVRRTPEGQVILLREVATVTDRWSDSPDRSWMNGQPSVVITISNTLSEDILSITDEVKEYIDDFNAKNDLVKATLVRDGSKVLRQRLDLLISNGIQGFLLVLLFLSLFLNWRLAFWVALSIPISFAGMFLVAYWMGITINVISLFGMIVVVGILVDDGIVIAENVYQYYERGVPRAKAALEGSINVIPSVVTSVLTTVIAFSSFSFLDGRIGDIFSVLGVVVILSLLFSLAEATFILPAHLAHSNGLRHDIKPGRVQRFFERLLDTMKRKWYAPLLRFALRHPMSMVAICTALLFLSLGLVSGGFVKTTIFPVIPRDNIAVNLRLPAGTREDITRDLLLRIQAVAEEVNDEFSEKYFGGKYRPIENIELKVGPTTYQGTLDLSLLDSEIRDSISATLISDAIRDRLGPVPQAEVLAFALPSPFGKPIAVSLLGNDYPSLKAAVEELRGELSSLTELRDVTDSNQEGLQEIHLRLKEKAMGMGITTRDIIAQVRQGFFGAEVQRLQRGEDEVRVWVRYGEDDRRDIDRLAEMRIRFPDGRAIPLAELAELEVRRGIIAIYHLDGLREIKVEADIARTDVSVTDINQDLRQNLVPAILAKYPSVKASFEGQNREQMKTVDSARIVLPVMLLLMFFAVAVTFRSLSQTLIVFSLIPFGFSAVVMGHWSLDLQISLFSFLGILALVGIQVNDGLVLVTTFNERMQKGDRVVRALFEASLSRFRPILLTSLTTIAGLAPLMLEKSFQAQFLIPMAASVAFGLALVTLLTLILLPAILIMTNRIKTWAVLQWEGVRPAAHLVEPAIDGRKSYLWLWIFFGALSIGGFIALVALTLRLSDLLLN